MNPDPPRLPPVSRLLECEYPRVRGIRAPYIKGQPTTGTPLGFRLHKAASEDPCDACRQAKRDSNPNRVRDERRREVAIAIAKVKTDEARAHKRAKLERTTLRLEREAAAAIRRPGRLDLEPRVARDLALKAEESRARLTALDARIARLS